VRLRFRSELARFEDYTPPGFENFATPITLGSRMNGDGDIPNLPPLAEPPAAASQDFPFRPGFERDAAF